jgi:hypothetical protein
MQPVSGIIILAVPLGWAASASMKSAELKRFDLEGEARAQYEGHHPHKATCTCHFNDSGYLVDSLVDSHYKLY